MAGKAKKEVKKDPLLDEEENAAAAAESSEAEQEESKEEKTEEKKPAAKPAPEAKLDPSDYAAVAAATKRKLMAGPKTMFMIPLAPGEKEGATEMVQLNGYKLTIKKGAMVEIPVPMANILAAHYRIEMSAGSEKRLDRSEDVAKALS